MYKPVPKSIEYNNITLFLVRTKDGHMVHPDTGFAFYCNTGKGGAVGVRVAPNGTKTLVNASYTTCENSKKNAKRKQRYLQFKSAWGRNKAILVSHAVYSACKGKNVPEGMTMDHIDGNPLNNYIVNLRVVTDAINKRDGGFMRKLRNKGLGRLLTSYSQDLILRYYGRMAQYKATHTEWRYRQLDAISLSLIFFAPDNDFLSFCEKNRTPYTIHRTPVK